jgi:hypothetical protein
MNVERICGLLSGYLELDRRVDFVSGVQLVQRLITIIPWVIGNSKQVGATRREYGRHD